MSIDAITNKAMLLGADEFGRSNKPGKRFYVVYKGKQIDFGSDSRETYFDIKDKQKQKAWVARHSVNLDKNGKKFINQKSSPLYWSFNLLWK